MRQVLIDCARRRHAARRGSGAHRVPLDETLLIREDCLDDALALDRALEKLEQIDPRQMQLVEMRFFAGLSIEEIARCLCLSKTTVNREWRSARAWLHREINAGGGHDSRAMVSN